MRGNQMKLLNKFAAAALGMAVLVAPAAAFAQDFYGAVAFSQSTGDSGWTKNYNTQQEAESEAIRYCRQNNGANDCKVYSYVNACFALAVGGDNGFGTDWGVNIT